MKFKWHLIKRAVRFWCQRRTRGWDDSETWSLDQPMARFILPRLKRFKELSNGYPHGITEEKWDKYLDDMIYAMGIYAHGCWDAPNETDWKRVKRGTRLFGEYFGALWW